MRNRAVIFSCIVTIVTVFFPRSVWAQTYSLESELEQLYEFEQLPHYRDGVIEQVSSYDTTGLNNDGFSGTYSFIRKEGDKLILADLKGPGVINRIWTPMPTTDTIQFYFDGEKTPCISIPFIDLFSGKIFPFLNPVCGNEVGGYYCYLPIQYSKSCKIAFTGKVIQFHQIQSRPYPKGTKVKSFSMDWSSNEKQALESARSFWNMETNALDKLKNYGVEVKMETKHFTLSPGESFPFFTNETGGRIVGIELECGNALEGANKDILLQAKWDNDSGYAINCPAADFFGYAYGKPAMRSILAGNSAGGVNYCYIPMPFEKKAEMKMVYEKRSGAAQPKAEMVVKVYYVPTPQEKAKEGRLYTIWRREIRPEDGKPYLFADIKDKGHYVGTIHLAQGLRPGMTIFFEGDDSTYIDGKMRLHGTGSEDYYNGGWYALLDRWDRGVSLPIHGSLDYSLQMCRTGAYRFYLTDKLTFENEIFHTIEHGPEHNLFPVDYTSIAFYYGSKPASNAINPTEELRTVYYPSTHVFFPQLMELSLGPDTRAEFRGWRLETTAPATGDEGIVRIMLNGIPEGKYKVGLTYFVTPDGCEFSVWNRQKQLSEWQSAFASEEKKIDRQELGIINLTPQSNSISILIRKKDAREKFYFDNLFLEKID